MPHQSQHVHSAPIRITRQDCIAELSLMSLKPCSLAYSGTTSDYLPQGNRRSSNHQPITTVGSNSLWRTPAQGMAQKPYSKIGLHAL